MGESGEDGRTGRGRPRFGGLRPVLVQGLLIGAIVVGVATVLVTMRSGAAPRGDAGDARPTPVVTQPARVSQSFTLTRRFTGLVRAETIAGLGFEIEGRVVDAPVAMGDRVQRGAVLGQLDTRRLEATRAQLEARLMDARARLEFRRGEFERADRLLNEPAGTQQRYDEALADLRTAEATVADLRAQIDAIEVDIEDATLEAPFAGVVLEKSFAPGDVVSPGAPVLRLLASDSLEARIGVPVTVAETMRLGDAVELAWRGRSIEGRVDALVPDVDARSRTTTVVVSLPEARGVTNGETLTLLVEESVQERGFWVPLDALVADLKGLWAVQVARGNGEGGYRIARAPVQVVHTDSTRAFVKGALSPGDPIVTRGTNRVSPGELIALADEASAEPTSPRARSPAPTSSEPRSDGSSSR